MDQLEWEELDEKALSSILLCLTNNVLQEVLKEKIVPVLWKKLDVLYTMKSLANRESLIYRRDHLLFEGVKVNLLSKDKVKNELGPNKKSNGQASILVARGRQQTGKTYRNRSKERSKFRNRNKYSGYYKKVGYIKVECWKR
ncbi:uncharacterized protein [Gossypium hirsutum]|uniref:Retrovirus-related Pol polyprotein from transposon TNT 1-94 n=1 Tax=Gossypium hirsutum TaxID=3635 RepID=A0ABM3AFY8_GOSHI|nr:uncharacterized protein LOC121219535 [Gossypium hirsutum]